MSILALILSCLLLYAGIKVYKNLKNKYDAILKILADTSDTDIKVLLESNSSKLQTDKPQSIESQNNKLNNSNIFPLHEKTLTYLIKKIKNALPLSNIQWKIKNTAHWSEGTIFYHSCKYYYIDKNCTWLIYSNNAKIQEIKQEYSLTYWDQEGFVIKIFNNHEVEQFITDAKYSNIQDSQKISLSLTELHYLRDKIIEYQKNPLEESSWWTITHIKDKWIEKTIFKIVGKNQFLYIDKNYVWTIWATGPELTRQPPLENWKEDVKVNQVFDYLQVEQFIEEVKNLEKKTHTETAIAHIEDVTPSGASVGAPIVIGNPGIPKCQCTQKCVHCDLTSY